ncbi:hypothetical protein [Yinghuangia seranimata]|uniref:hypothetical protein n=1 Tax=Yinghuangia seranimata TaxID=408067 RepID=UPI00248BA523|nr:hypothetical protein [Yinghuangia seranimata]MDI2124818.1 hypothetical protein [Yinghuangia seranimata]
MGDLKRGFRSKKGQWPRFGLSRRDLLHNAPVFLGLALLSALYWAAVVAIGVLVVKLLW